MLPIQDTRHPGSARGAFTHRFVPSGLGDKLLDFLFSSHILESLGYRFAGFDPRGLNATTRISGYRGSDADFFQRVGLDAQACDADALRNVLHLDYRGTVDLDPSSLVSQVERRIGALAMGGDHSSVQLTIGALTCNGLIESGFPFQNLNPRAFQQLGQCLRSKVPVDDGRVQVVLHLRMGDVANLRLADSEWVVPFESWAQRRLLRHGTGALRQHERSDRLDEVEAILRGLAASPLRSRLHITLISDGFEYCREFLRQHLDVLLSPDGLRTAYGTSPQFADAIDEREARARSLLPLCDRVIWGESAEHLAECVFALL